MEHYAIETDAVYKGGFRASFSPPGLASFRIFCLVVPACLSYSAGLRTHPSFQSGPSRPWRSHHEAYSWKTCGHEGCFQPARSDCRRRHGPARLAEEGSGPMPAITNWKSSRSRQRSSDPACQRHPARPRVGTARGQGARQRAPACCWPMRRPAMTSRRPAVLPDLLDHWCVKRLKEAGADCLKILLYYAPDDDPRRSTT